MARPQFGDNVCWTLLNNRGQPQQYMGKLTKEVELVGRVYDQDPKYTFENGELIGLELRFQATPCLDSVTPGASSRRGGTRRLKRKTRRVRRAGSRRVRK